MQYEKGKWLEKTLLSFFLPPAIARIVWITSVLTSLIHIFMVILSKDLIVNFKYIGTKLLSYKIGIYTEHFRIRIRKGCRKHPGPRAGQVPFQIHILMF
jgi:hypothetical protein